MTVRNKGEGARVPVAAELAFAMGFWGSRGVEIDFSTTCKRTGVATFWVLPMVVLLSRDKPPHAPPAEATPAVVLQDTM